MIFSESIGEDNGSYVGFIECGSLGVHSFSVRHHQTQRQQLDLQSLHVDDALGSILRPILSKPWFKQRLDKCNTLNALAAEMQTMIHEIVAQDKSASGSSSSSTNSSDLVQLLMRHLDDMGWDRVLKVNEDMTVIQMRSVDSANREHVFDVVIPPEYPRVPPIVQAVLPCRIALPWSTTGGNLVEMITIVDREVKRFEKLFDELTEIDRFTWVLEPAQPTFAITSRRLAIERSCSVVLDINPDSPREPCRMQFFGPPNRVNHFRINVGKNLYRWSKDKSVRVNLEAVLDIELPNKNTRSDAEATGSLCEECGICYSYSLSTADGGTAGGGGMNKAAGGAEVSGSGLTTVVPDQACPNTKCGKMYHAECLIDWLQSLPTTKSSFGTVFGTCPYCSELISVRIQTR